MAEKSENLILGLEAEGQLESWEQLKTKYLAAEWQPELGDLLLLGLYGHFYQLKLEQFIEGLDLSKIENDLHTRDVFDSRKSRTNREKLTEIKNVIQEMKQRRKSNDILAFVIPKNGVR